MNKRQKSSDGHLILQYKEGNTSVLPVLVERYHKIFCEKAYWITKDKEMAKDVAQDCWITIIDKLSTLKNVNSFKSWAFRIVYTKSIDAVKQRNKEDRNILSAIASEPEPQESADERGQIRLALLKGIQELPKRKQDIIRLFYAEEYSIIEISTFLNIPVGTVKSRLFKAREKLKSILKK